MTQEEAPQIPFILQHLRACLPRLHVARPEFLHGESQFGGGLPSVRQAAKRFPQRLHLIASLEVRDHGLAKPDGLGEIRIRLRGLHFPKAPVEVRGGGRRLGRRRRCGNGGGRGRRRGGGRRRHSPRSDRSAPEGQGETSKNDRPMSMHGSYFLLRGDVGR